MENIIIYTNEQCPYCKQVKEEFEKNNIKFEEKSTQEYLDEWHSINNLTGIPSVPTISYKDNYFVPGRDFFSAKQIIEIIKNYKDSSFPMNKQLIEKIKTLTYNIQAAFGRTDQILRQIETKLNNKENGNEKSS